MPAAAAHRLSDAALMLDASLAFASFCLVASATYLANDIADVEHDRAHPAKRHRPVASGALSRGAAGVGAFLLAAASLVLALQLGRAFLVAWALYVVSTSVYSLGLKRLVVLDVVVLSGLYTVRVVAGALAADVPLSRWFLAFSVFLFLSLALLKRAVEALDASRKPAGGDVGGAGAPLRGRGWQAGDLPVLLSMGAASAVAAALVYCLYITGEDVLRLYGRPDVLWVGLPVLLYWLTRAWLLAARGQVHEDPVIFAMRDPASWAALAVFAVSVWAAS